LLAFAFLLFTLPSFAAETRGLKRVEIKTQAGELVGLYEQSHALVIGVSNYTGGWPRLRGVREDVRQALEEQRLEQSLKFNVPPNINPEFNS
jgi:hypothetical protein